MRKSSVDHGEPNSSSTFVETDPSRTSKLRSIARAGSIEQYHWANLIRFIFPNGDSRTSIGICSLTQDGSITDFISRFCVQAVRHLQSPVLLIEAHVNGPSLAEMHGVLPAPGLGDLLASSPEPLYQCIRRTNCAQLWIIPFGRALPTHDDQRLEMSYRTMYAALPPGLRNIVIAMPPITANRDLPFRWLASDRIVFVVRPRSVTGRDIRAAMRRMSKTSTKVAGVIWTDQLPL